MEKDNDSNTKNNLNAINKQIKNLDITKNHSSYSATQKESIEPNFVNSYVRILQKAPYFESTAWSGKEFTKINLNDYKDKWLILFFYPLDFTFVCPTEICGLDELYNDFKKLNCEILAVSVDSELSHKYFSLKPKTKGGIFPCKIPLLSDFSKRISLDYGVLFDEGIDEGVSKRATFIIDNNQIIRSIDINDSPVGRNIEEILRRLKDLQGVKSEF